MILFFALLIQLQMLLKKWIFNFRISLVNVHKPVDYLKKS